MATFLTPYTVPGARWKGIPSCAFNLPYSSDEILSVSQKLSVVKFFEVIWRIKKWLIIYNFDLEISGADSGQRGSGSFIWDVNTAGTGGGQGASAIKISDELGLICNDWSWNIAASNIPKQAKITDISGGQSVQTITRMAQGFEMYSKNGVYGFRPIVEIDTFGASYISMDYDEDSFPRKIGQVESNYFNAIWPVYGVSLNPGDGFQYLFKACNISIEPIERWPYKN